MPDDEPADTTFQPRRAEGAVGGARPVDAANPPRRATDAVPARAPQREPERLLPKPLQRVLGFIILFSTVGVLSCQAFLD